MAHRTISNDDKGKTAVRERGEHVGTAAPVLSSAAHAANCPCIK